MLVNLLRIKETDMVNLFGEMVELTVDFGERASSMERDFISLMMGE